jgi:hypothetical protein
VNGQLRDNSDDATAKGVFGVPTLQINGQILWSDDATHVRAYLGKPDFFDGEEMRLSMTCHWVTHMANDTYLALEIEQMIR